MSKKYNQITDDEIKKTEAYATALGKLDNSLNDITKTLPKFAGGLEEGLAAIAEKLPDVVKSMTDLNKQNKELATNGEKPASLLSQFGSAVLSWNNALSVAVGLLTTYAPKILSFVGNLFESKKVKDAAQALKDYTDVWSQYIRNVANERGELQTLLSIANNEKISKENRLEAIKRLNALSPQYLGSLTSANIKTREGTEAINEYVKALKRKALEEAVQPKMAELLRERMELTEGYQAAKKDVNKYRRARKKNPDAGKLFSVNQGSALGTTTTTDFGVAAERKFTEYVNKDADIIKRIKKVDDFLTQQLEGLSPKPVVEKKAEGKSYWLNILDDQQAELDKLDAGAKDFEKKAKPIIDRIAKTKKTLSKYNLKHESISQTSNVSNNSLTPPEDKVINPRGPEIEAPQLGFGNSIKSSLDQSVQKSLDTQKNVLLNKTIETQRIITDIEVKSAKERAEAEEQSVKSKIHSGGKFIDAALKNSKKDSTIFKAAFLAKKATSIADTVISTKQAVMESFKAYAGIPFIGQALGIAQAIFMGAQGASSIAEIAKQKPGFAEGGQFRSDGKGALLPGYSRTDNTNAYLRSGEAVVVSEAMRNPWARNLVSAINVAHGGRDFSITNPGRGYAIGGIFTDGGNSNRYYNQPMNDVKDLANTLAYQMINNFPPVYVDVKDINSQQSILAQTVNRVNL